MSWLTAFKIGLWNTWILMLYVPLHPLIMMVVDKAVGTGGIFKKMGDALYEKGEKRDFVISMIISFLLITYSVSLPLKLGTVWFYMGLMIYLVGLVIFLTAIVNIAVTPIGRPFVKGMYRFSRHPMLVAESITFVGVSMASASWIFLFFTVVFIFLQISQAEAEERGCFKTYGDEYKEYMNRTPRWMGIPKSS